MNCNRLIALSALCLVSMLHAPQFAAADETVGNPLIPRATTDTSPGSIFLLDDGFTQSGFLTDWGLFRGGTTLEITPVIFEPDGANYRIAGIGATRNVVPGQGVHTFDFDLVSGSADVGPGSLFGWKDGSNGANNTGVAEWTNGGPAVAYFGAGHTTFNVGDSLPVSLNLNRTYSVEAVTTGGSGPVETIGNPIVDGPLVDSAVGAMFVMTGNPFTAEGTVSEWSFFNDNLVAPPPLDITPLILEDVAGSVFIRGIGQTRSVSGIGEQHFDFDLVSGSDAVGANRFFGWKDGSNGANNTGVAPFDGPAGDFVRWFGGGHTTFAAGDNLGTPNLVLERTYSLEAHAVPEPTAALLALVGISGMTTLCRYRRPVA